MNSIEGVTARDVDGVRVVEDEQTVFERMCTAARNSCNTTTAPKEFYTYGGLPRIFMIAAMRNRATDDPRDALTKFKRHRLYAVDVLRVVGDYADCGDYEEPIPYSMLVDPSALTNALLDNLLHDVLYRIAKKIHKPFSNMLSFDPHYAARGRVAFKLKFAPAFQDQQPWTMIINCGICNYPLAVCLCIRCTCCGTHVRSVGGWQRPHEAEMLIMPCRTCRGNRIHARDRPQGVHDRSNTSPLMHLVMLFATSQYQRVQTILLAHNKWCREIKGLPASAAGSPPAQCPPQ